MQNKVQLYIENQRVDLFQDETIELTSSIQDARDIGKIFTDYSKAFNVPASPSNNKIFKHYYNYNITTGAFDARQKKTAAIEINHLPFRIGKIFLQGVDMRNNKPFNYRIVFYGHTVSLKELLGDDKFSDKNSDGTFLFSYLENYNHEYSETNVRNGLKDGLDFTVNSVSQTDAIIYPLITSKKRLFFNSSATLSNDENFDGNIYHDTSTPDTIRGLEFTDLKPAIKAIHLIEAIESTYDIEFTRTVPTTSGSTRNTFFNSTPFSNLYLWMNNKKGEITDVDDDEGFIYSSKLTGYTSSDPHPTSVVDFDGSKIILNANDYGFLMTLTVTLDSADSDKDYQVKLINLTDNIEFTASRLLNGIYLLPIVFGSVVPGLTDIPDKEYEIIIESKEQLTISSTSFAITSQQGAVSTEKTYTTASQDTEVQIVVPNRMPEMKVIDFLTGLFKLFNLTAYYIDEVADTNYGKIYVDTLDNFYSDAIYNHSGGTTDIAKYIDNTNHKVNSLLPFTDIDFKYTENSTVLMEHHTEQFDEVFGDAEFNIRRKYPNIDRGSKYEIKVPFSHMKYERLRDLNTLSTETSSLTDIQWGYCASGDFTATDYDAGPPIVPAKGDYDKTLIKPLLFYGIRETGLSSTRKINYISTSSPTGIDNYWRPSNAQDEGTSATAPSYTLNFDLEFDEWQTTNYGDNTNSLYEVFYKNYVESVFDPTKRLFKFRGYLPANIIVNFRLNDQFKIQDNIFRINLMIINLVTGESNLELINLAYNEIV